MEPQKTLSSQKKEEQSWRYHTSDFKVYYKAVIKQYVMGMKTDTDINGIR